MEIQANKLETSHVISQSRSRTTKFSSLQWARPLATSSTSQKRKITLTNKSQTPWTLALQTMTHNTIRRADYRITRTHGKILSLAQRLKSRESRPVRETSCRCLSSLTRMDSHLQSNTSASQDGSHLETLAMTWKFRTVLKPRLPLSSSSSQLVLD